MADQQEEAATANKNVENVSTEKKEEEEEEELPSMDMKTKIYKGVVLWESAQVDQLPDFRVRDDDVWVCSFPRSVVVHASTNGAQCYQVTVDTTYTRTKIGQTDRHTNMADQQEEAATSNKNIEKEEEEEEEELPTADMKTKIYKGVVLWESAQMDQLPDFRVRDDDVWVCSFPRSGTTLTQTITYLVMTLDFEKARSVQLDDRFPIVEVKDDRYPYYRGLEYLDQMTSPRMIKSHLHHFLLPDDIRIRKKGRIVYICRNPKASMSSLYRVLSYLLLKPADTLTEYFENFLKGEKVLHGPWWKHVQQFWEIRNDPNVLFLQFEKLIKDRKAAIRQIADFLGRTLTDDDVQAIFDETTIEKMKGNEAVNFAYQEDLWKTDKSDGAFINTGEVSGWRRDVPDDINQRIDEMLQRELGHTDLKFE